MYSQIRWRYDDWGWYSFPLFCYLQSEAVYLNIFQSEDRYLMVLHFKIICFRRMLELCFFFVSKRFNSWLVFYLFWNDQNLQLHQLYQLYCMIWFCSISSCLHFAPPPPLLRHLCFGDRFQIYPMRIECNAKRKMCVATNRFVRNYLYGRFDVTCHSQYNKMWVRSSSIISQIIIIINNRKFDSVLFEVSFVNVLNMWRCLLRAKSWPQTKWAFAKLIVSSHTFHLIKLSFVDNKISWPKRCVSQRKMCV